MKKIFLILFLSITSIALGAQAGASSKLVWDQTATDLATANALSYKYYEGTIAVALSNVICTGTVSPFVCSVAYPAFTPGGHTIQLTATNSAGESPKSPVFAFTFVVIPAAPANVRIGN